MPNSIQIFIGNVSIILGVAGGVLTLMNWWLPKDSKQWISDKADTLWIWLSYQRTWPFLKKLQNPNAFTLILLLGSVLFFTGSMLFYIPVTTSAKPSLATFESGSLIPGVLVGLFAMSKLRRWFQRGFVWITTTSKSAELMLRAMGTFCAMAIVLYIIMLSLQAIHSKEPTNFIYAAQLLLLLAGVPVFLALVLMGIICAYLIGVFVLIAVFKLLQAITLRAADYDKGPILGLAALLAALGGILTAFAHH
jgi:hypothetical protein